MYSNPLYFKKVFKIQKFLLLFFQIQKINELMSQQDIERKWNLLIFSLKSVQLLLQTNKEIGDKYGIHPRDVESKQIS